MNFHIANPQDSGRHGMSGRQNVFKIKLHLMKGTKISPQNMIHELKSHPETESNNNIASDAIEMRTIERVIMQHREEIVCMKNIMTTEPIDSPCRMHSR
ncbi:uncharacterized protein LOC114878018 isoform X2 [Osmia bicornis bicornis]|uniref:uncharacterized protein LOC114878018 isoform X2 n=1 Tax=Osmia bicornis bicornis TaxID=1437191 RepID=UPI001EAEAA68|nr:uncharacterized protein LOC114878018 isoform X2 [Osmia bicornis bicornis]